MNTVTLSGNLTRDPEIRYSKEGNASTIFGMAVNRRWQERGSDTWTEETSFFDVTCTNDLAENVVLSFCKGMRVMVTGRLQQNGDRRTRVEVAADDIAASVRFTTCEVNINHPLFPQPPVVPDSLFGG